MTCRLQDLLIKHRTHQNRFPGQGPGIGAATVVGDRATTAATKRINDMGGINGRPVEIVAEDDGTDPKRGAEVVEKFSGNTIGCHLWCPLQSCGGLARAGELKMPYFVVSKGTTSPAAS